VGKRFLNFPLLRFIPVDDEIIRRSQVIREKYNLKPRDSIHLSCAIEQLTMQTLMESRKLQGYQLNSKTV
jgi:hypothetical protein